MQTFVVRVFVPAQDGAVTLRGVVEHVASGETATFEETGGLVAFLEERLGISDRQKEEA